MLKILLVAIVLLVLINPSQVFAVSLNISNVPAIIVDQPFQFNGSITGAQKGTNYLRVSLSPLGTTNYFGYTFNGSFFYNGSDFSLYLPVNIDSSGNWSGVIIGKLDSSSSYYKDSGQYNLKVRRYTSASSYLWSNEVNINIQTDSSMPTPNPTATPTPTPSEPSSNDNLSNSSVFNVYNVSSNINSDNILNAKINLSLPANKNSKYFLKGAFVKAGGNNYFGLTEVLGNWVKNSDNFSNQMPIITDSVGNWSGDINVMIDSQDSGFSGSGDYIFKVARYSENGSGPIWSNQSNVYINNVVINTPTPTSTNKASPSSTSIEVKNSTTKTTNNPVVNTTLSTSTKPNSDLKLPQQLFADGLNHLASVAGISTSSANIPSETIVKASLTPNYLFLVGGLAVLCLGGGVIMFILHKYTAKNYDFKK